MPLADVCIAGAGLIGLTLARSLAETGLSVLVLTRVTPLNEASQAAAGMLAVDDPDNPAALHPLSQLSRSLYPAFLDRIAADSGHRVRFQTQRTLQFTAAPRPVGLPVLSASQLQSLVPTLPSAPHAVLDLVEASLDPRELSLSLIASLPAQPRIDLRPHTPVERVAASPAGVVVHTTSGEQIAAGAFVDCTGAWSLASSLDPSLRILPRKGQMLTIPTPPALARHALVLRTHELYLVPRLHGPRAGHCVLGATVEDVGFDRAVEPHALQNLLSLASHLLPELATAPILSSWSGLRPATSDLLPILGRLRPPLARHPLPLFIASGHFRNGILLAPATAAVLTDLIRGRPPALALEAFSPDRFVSIPPL